MASTTKPHPFSVSVGQLAIPTGLRLGFELTFVPRRPGSHWQEWKSQDEAWKVTDAFNKRLWDSLEVLGLAVVESNIPQKLVWGKADIFRSIQLSAEPQPHNSWCLEVNNAPIQIRNLYSGSMTYYVLEKVYSIAASLDLYPCITRRRRDGILIEYPTGGGHQHVQIDFWNEGSTFLLKLYALEQALCIDFCNNPWIRWLFSQWFDNLNSAVAINLKHLKRINRARCEATPKNRQSWDGDGVHRYAHDMGLSCHSIKQRIAQTGKPVRPTFEFRFFDMPKDMGELMLHSRFLEAWIEYHVMQINAWGVFQIIDTTSRFDLNVRHYNRLTKDMEYAKGRIETFMLKIGLRAEEVKKMLDTFFGDHYCRRMKYGKAI